MQLLYLNKFPAGSAGHHFLNRALHFPADDRPPSLFLARKETPLRSLYFLTFCETNPCTELNVSQRRALRNTSRICGFIVRCFIPTWRSPNAFAPNFPKRIRTDRSTGEFSQVPYEETPFANAHQEIYCETAPGYCLLSQLTGFL